MKFKDFLKNGKDGKNQDRLAEMLSSNNLMHSLGQAIGMVSEYRFTLCSRDGGQVSKGVAKVSWENTGVAVVQVDGELYEGRWVYSETGVSNVQIDMSKGGLGVTANLKGVGNLVLKSSSNLDKQIVCEFGFDESTAKGWGKGRGSNGRVYDMEIIGSP